MNIKGEEAREAIVDWVKEEIKKSPTHVHELGKFFFGVSAATVGFLAMKENFSDEKTFENAQAIVLLIISFCFLLITMAISIHMAIPRFWKLTGNTNIFVEHQIFVKKSRMLVISWFLLWTIGLVLGVLGIFS